MAALRPFTSFPVLGAAPGIRTFVDDQFFGPFILGHCSIGDHASAPDISRVFSASRFLIRREERFDVGLSMLALKYPAVRHDWTRTEVELLLDLPLPELMFRAMSVHRATFDPVEIQLSQLLSVKTGGCAEDCGYCSQSAHFDTGLKASKLMAAEAVIADAERAKEQGAQRFCMGAAWREMKDRDLPELTRMISGVKALGLETCATPWYAYRATSVPIEGCRPRLLQP